MRTGDQIGTASSLRALIVIPTGVNYFYEDIGRRIEGALQSLGIATRLATPKESFLEPYDMCFIVNASEVAHCIGDESAALRTLQKLRQIAQMCTVVLLDSVQTPWFMRNLHLCQQAEITNIIDLGFHDQRGWLPHGLGDVQYHFAFNGLTESEHDALQRLDAARENRSIPWVMIGHQTSQRAQLAQKLSQEFSSEGVVYLPYLTAFTEQGPHLNGPQLDTLLLHTKYQIWCSHHRYFYLESERFRASLLTGGVPIKVLQDPVDISEQIPFPYLLVEADNLIDYLTQLDFAETQQRYRDDFAALPTLDESLLQAVMQMNTA